VQGDSRSTSEECYSQPILSPDLLTANHASIGYTSSSVTVVVTEQDLIRGSRAGHRYQTTSDNVNKQHRRRQLPSYSTCRHTPRSTYIFDNNRRILADNHRIERDHRPVPISRIIDRYQPITVDRWSFRSNPTNPLVL
jgi:hypothetical protein